MAIQNRFIVSLMFLWFLLSSSSFCLSQNIELNIAINSIKKDQGVMVAYLEFKLKNNTDNYLTIYQPISAGNSLKLEIKDKQGDLYKYIGAVYKILGNYVVQLSPGEYFGGSANFFPDVDFKMKGGETYTVTGTLHLQQEQGDFPQIIFKDVEVRSNTLEIKIPE